MTFKLGAKSMARLGTVHHELAAVVMKAIEISEVDFTVLEGKRTIERQKQLFDDGLSKTMNSRHLTGHAVDLGAWVDGSVSWDKKYYAMINEAMQEAAGKLGVHVEWGGEFKGFFDGPHFQLPWGDYP